MNLQEKNKRKYNSIVKKMDFDKEIKEKILFYYPKNIEELLQIKGIDEEWMNKNKNFIKFLDTLILLEEEKINPKTNTVLNNFSQKLSMISQKSKMIWTSKVNIANNIDLSILETKVIKSIDEIIKNPKDDKKAVEIKIKRSQISLVGNSDFKKQIEKYEKFLEDDDEYKKMKNEKIIFKRVNYDYFSKIINKNNEIKKEKGQNLLYIAKYYLEGNYFANDKDFALRAPIFLFPVELKRNERISEIKIKNDPSRDIIVNPFILQNILKKKTYIYNYKKTIEENVKLLFEGIKYDVSNTRLTYFETLSIKEVISNLGYRIKNHLILGIFNQFDSSIQEEINEIRKSKMVGRNIIETFSEYDIYEREAINKINNEIETKINDDEDIYYIDKLNYQQVLALKKINHNDLNHLTIWGPPGTGKSQTILSIIIDALIKNKKVAVVTEKKVALDVIYERLGELKDFALLITDLNSKNEFYDQIKSSFEAIEKFSTNPKPIKNIDYTKRLKNNLDNLDKIDFKENMEELNNKTFLEVFSEIQPHLLNNKKLQFFVKYKIDLIKFNKNISYQDAVDIFMLIENNFSINGLVNFYNFNKKYIDFENYDNIVNKITETLNNLIDAQKINEEKKNNLEILNKLVFEYKTISKWSWIKKWKFRKVIYKQTFLKTKDEIQKFNQEQELLLLINQNENLIKEVSIYENELKNIQEKEWQINKFKNLNSVQIEWIQKIIEYSRKTELDEDKSRLLNKVLFNFIIEEQVINNTLFKVLENKINNWKTQILNIDEIQDKLTMFNKNLVVQKVVEQFKNDLEFNSRSKTIEKIVNSKNKNAIIDFFQKYGLEIKKSFPIWLMRPDVLANLFTPLEKFDIILVDEASQLFVEQALPALQHSRKIVVLGDEKQLSPSSFFQTKFENEDEQIEYIENDDSLLDFAKTKFPSVMLKNHYRSNYSDLIEFSNIKFYDGNLIVTDNNSNKTKSSISFIKVKNGIFTNATNIEEAKTIIETITKISQNSTTKNMSLGIITMNNSQKELLETMITQSSKKDPVLNKYVKKSNLFVKSIENVQGDERDIIVLSTTYGYDVNGNLNVRFGPINNQGGENRINVAITRSKEKMYVVSSFDPYELTAKVQKAKNNGPRILADFLVYSMDPKQWLEVNKTKSKIEVESDSYMINLFETLEKTIKRKFGFDLIRDTTNSNFGMDFIVYDPKRKRNILGLETDLRSFDESKFARDRDISKMQYLTSRGWKVHRIWTLNWIKNEKKEIAAIMKEISLLSE